MNGNIKLDKICTYIILILSIIVVTTLYLTKSEVMSLDSEIKEIHRQITEEKKSINLLSAEASYLHAANNLKHYLGKDNQFKKIELVQIVENPLNASCGTQGQTIIAEIANKNSSYKNVKWRYKKSQHAVIPVSSTKNLNKGR